ncbi:MAG: hypothetical protein AB7F59_06845 [Bdellovibrionales bacterium]
MKTEVVSSLPAALCSNSTAQNALTTLEWYNKSFGYQSLARSTALEEMLTIRMWSKWIAYGSTFLFALCVAFLMGYLVWRLLKNDDEALLPSNDLSLVQLKKWMEWKALSTKHMITSIMVGQIYFFAIIFLISLSSRSIQSVVEEFRAEYAEPVVSVASLSEKPKTPSEVYDFLSEVSEDIRSVPEAFTVKSAFIPSEARWWTLGWDELALVDFQVEVVKAMLRRSQVGEAGVKHLIPAVTTYCKKGHVEI